MQITDKETKLLLARRAKFDLLSSGPFVPNSGELCFLARKREGLTVRHVMDKLRTSHVSILKMERGAWDSRRLAIYFNNQHGYSIPVSPAKNSEKQIKMYEKKIADLRMP